MARPLPWGLEQAKKRGPWMPITVLILVVITFGVIIYMLGPTLETPTDSCASNNASPSELNVQLLAGTKRTFDIEYAKTPLQRELGLSDRPCFPKNAALLFLFPGDDTYGIWMKDMRFPIDVVWLDKNKKVVSIEEDMQPSSYPKVFYPTEDARYVLEFTKGTVDELQASIGSVFTW